MTKRDFQAMEYAVEASESPLPGAQDGDAVAVRLICDWIADIERAMQQESDDPTPEDEWGRGWNEHRSLARQRLRNIVDRVRTEQAWQEPRTPVEAT